MLYTQLWQHTAIIEQAYFMKLTNLLNIISTKLSELK